ncbi:Penicillin-binding protein PbpB [Dyadobacter sp. CECT 9623]|uniref:Penicillin-binding protein PbpB n=1 Tax=Dyadobacter linearis TaxID=2823330 RepID=A0ABM8UX14_9BACT|nr:MULTISPECIES: penicillin-binding protein [unclassified Dyadobacter]MCE7063000.1 transpeptidase family protein [Dyadobacter sp. CY343]CAG5073770.1 Penicillin-binding protein PbpB [Dyadobacter sp. CECT 9623]
MKNEVESGQNNKKALINRARTVGWLLFLLAILVFVKLIRVQYYDEFKGKTWAEYSAKNDLKLDTIPAMRGNIYSNDKSLLATSLPYYYIGLDTKVADSTYFDEHIDELSSLLAKSFGEHTAAGYRSKIMRYRVSKTKRYLRLKSREISYLDREKVKKWPFFAKHKKGGGGKFETIYKRYKPYSPMADRTIGGIDAKSGRGYIGLEASFDKILEGKSGIGWVELVEGGMKIPVGDALNVQPEAGRDVYTTLDMKVQDMAEIALRRKLNEMDADFGSVVIMEVKTGEIRAMANLTKRGDHKYEEVFNYALAGSNDPGSTFKLATMMAILEETKMDPDKIMVNTGNGAMRFRSNIIRDAHRGGFGTITAAQVLEKSSNIGIVQLMLRYFADKPDQYLKYLKQFHLTTPTDIQMKGEKPPLIRDRTSKQWSSYSMYYMAHGYEMQMTPLQTLALYNAVANDGYWVRPMIVKEIRNAEELEDKMEPYVEEKPICSPETIRKVKKMLEGVVNNGLAKHIKSDLYKIAGKTGTARKLINGIYTEGKNYTSFAGYFPADKPKYSCIVVIDNPKSSGADYTRYAGSVAAPVFKEVADRIYASEVGIQKPVIDSLPAESKAVMWAGRTSDLKVISKELKLTPAPEDAEYAAASLYKKGKTNWKKTDLGSKDVPDLQGMAMRDALYLLENKGFRVTFKGSGKVVEQSLPPGANQSGGKTILLTLQ